MREHQREPSIPHEPLSSDRRDALRVLGAASMAMLAAASLTDAGDAKTKSRRSHHKHRANAAKNGGKGKPGPTGPTGPTGPAGGGTGAGPTGPTGPTGTAGSSGGPGPTGPTGAQGSAGSVGPTGAQGNIGPTGPAGSSSLSVKRFGPARVGAGQLESIAECNPGEHATGGGFSIQALEMTNSFVSEPYAPNAFLPPRGWLVRGTGNSQASSQLAAYVVCVAD
jgi:hypothetical protein